MENFDNSRKRQHLREVLLHYYFSKKKATEAHRLIVECYGEDHALSVKQCQKWFQRFKDGDFDISDKERPGQPKKFTDEALEKLLEENPNITQGELANALNVSQAAVSKRLKALGMVQT